jgi:hypothetical protein
MLMKQDKTQKTSHASEGYNHKKAPYGKHTG